MKKIEISEKIILDEQESKIYESLKPLYEKYSSKAGIYHSFDKYLITAGLTVLLMEFEKELLNTKNFEGHA
jgi:hypothetical protein